MEEKRDRCVYVKFRLNGAPCYVGKGGQRRPFTHLYSALRGRHPNAHLSAILVKAGTDLPTVIVKNWLTNTEASELEILLIAAIGREPNGPLVNMTDGGEGAPGLKMSPEARAKISAKNKGHKYSLGQKRSRETRLRMSLAQKGRNPSPQTIVAVRRANAHRTVSEEARKKIGQASKGNKYAVGNKNCLGQKRTPEARERMRHSALKYWSSSKAVEARVALSARLRTRVVSEKTRERMRQAAARRKEAKRVLCLS